MHAFRASGGVTSRVVYAWHHVEYVPRDRIFCGLWEDRASMLAHAAKPYMRHFQDTREPLVESESTRADYLVLTDGKTPTDLTDLQGAAHS